MPAPKSPYRLGMAGFAVISLLAMPTAAVAVDDEAAAHIQHYIECLTWLLTDPAKHALYCTPAREFNMPENGEIPPVVSIGPFTTPSAWSVSSSCEGICFPTSEPSQPTSEPSQPTSEPSQPTEEPSLPTEEPSLPTEEPSLPTEEPSLPTEEPSLPPTEEPPPQPPCEGYYCFPT